MLAVIDYGAGNLRSVLHALNYLTAENVRVVQTARDLKGAEKIILPGVGAFGAGMQKLREHDLIQPIKDAVFAGTSYLGICLGMQFLFERSDEMGEHEGLGILPGYVTRFPNNLGLKVPHMGWNNVLQTHPHPLWQDIDDDERFYFVHSYFCEPIDQLATVATTNYAGPFTAAIARGNIFATQFHPEKSHRAGLTLYKNFLSWMPT